MKKFFALAWVALFSFSLPSTAQTPEEIIANVKAKLDRVNDYEARGKMKMNVTFIKAPIATIRIYYRKPDKLKIHNEKGISLVPKGSVNISIGKLVANSSDCDLIDVGIEQKTGWRIIKLLPKSDTADIVLSTLFIDEKELLVRKAKTTTRENGTYELEMTYGKYSGYGLADKIVFSFNTKEYKLPKGVTFDYDDGAKSKPDADKMKNRKGRVEITYNSYQINKGLPDSVFN
jgi:outer membrane lipoprotein-sorting protein